MVTVMFRPVLSSVNRGPAQTLMTALLSSAASDALAAVMAAFIATAAAAAAAGDGLPARSEVLHGVGAANARHVHPCDGDGNFVYQDRARTMRRGADRAWGERVSACKDCSPRHFHAAIA